MEKMTLNEAIEHLDDILQNKEWECEECKNEHIQLKYWLDELKAYKVLEEQGKLMKLPCAVGDRIYRIDTDVRMPNRKIEICDIDNIVIASNGKILLKQDAYDDVICELENIVTDKPYLDFYRCFLTQEEAVAVLKEL